MQLIGSIHSPYVRKVRVVLAEKRQPCEFVVEDPSSPTNRIARSNPLGKVPCLVLDSGEAVFDSRVIVEYLDALTPAPRLIPDDARQRAVVRNWEALADGVLDAAVLARMEFIWPGRPDAQRCQAWIDRQLGKAHAGVEAIAQALGDHRHCCGDRFTLADIAVACALDWLQFRFGQEDWLGPYPQLAAWHGAMRQRASLAATAP